MRKLKGLFARKEDIFKPKILSFREFCQYVYDPAQRVKRKKSLKYAEDERSGNGLSKTSNNSLH